MSHDSSVGSVVRSSRQEGPHPTGIPRLNSFDYWANCAFSEWTPRIYIQNSTVAVKDQRLTRPPLPRADNPLQTAFNMTFGRDLLNTSAQSCRNSQPEYCIDFSTALRRACRRMYMTRTNRGSRRISLSSPEAVGSGGSGAPHNSPPILRGCLSVPTLSQVSSIHHQNLAVSPHL